MVVDLLTCRIMYLFHMEMSEGERKKSDGEDSCGYELDGWKMVGFSLDFCGCIPLNRHFEGNKNYLKKKKKATKSVWWWSWARLDLG